MKGIISLMVSIIIISIILTLSIVGSINRNIKQIESNIGKRVVLQGDTLMIIDYSIIKYNYILENGKSIDIKLIDKLECIDENM